MKRYSIDVAGTNFLLAQGRDVQRVKDDMVSAIRSGGDLVDLIVVGNIEISVLVSPGVAIIFRAEDVEVDDRDTGDLARPFDPLNALEYFDSLI